MSHVECAVVCRPMSPMQEYAVDEMASYMQFRQRLNCLAKLIKQFHGAIYLGWSHFSKFSSMMTSGCGGCVMTYFPVDIGDMLQHRN